MSDLDQMANKLQPIIIGGKFQLCVNEFFPCNWCSIFNTKKFFELHKTEGSYYFQLCVGSPPEVSGVVHFTSVAAGHFRSPRRGTFGSFEFRETLRMEVFEEFVNEVERILMANGGHTIEILEPPAILDLSRAAVLYNILTRKGYLVQHPELDFALVVDNTKFPEKVEYNIRKRINKCTREGLVARQIDASFCRQAYEVIAQNRAAKGFPMTMTCEEILKMLEVFPERMVFFGAFAGDKLIASSICIKVSRSMLYVFYWGDLPGYEKLSPVTLLAESIYNYAQGNNFSLMDVGTSTEEGLPIYGLINFKRELGCMESLKLSFIKNIPG